MSRKCETEPDGFLKAVGKGIAEEAKFSLRWASWGALCGAVILGAGALDDFGPCGLLFGAALGALIGGIGTWIVVLTA